MCGRYRLSRRKQVIEEYFETVSDEPDWAPRYNIAPTQPVPVIRQHPKEPVRQISTMRWGLILTCRKSFVASDSYFGCDCSMLETLYQTILHDPPL